MWDITWWTDDRKCRECDLEEKEGEEGDGTSGEAVQLAAVGNADSWTAGNYSDPFPLRQCCPNPAMLPMAPLISSTTVCQVIQRQCGSDRPD